MISYILAVVVAVFGLALDQITKYLVMTNLTLNCTPTPLVPYVLNLTYIHNRGGAWGIFSSHRAILLTLTVLVMAFCVIALVKYCKGKPLLFWSVSLVLSGGIGNMYDRIFRDGNVVDFLQFGFWTDFPVFNIADIFVCIGAGLMMLYFVIDIVKDYKSGDKSDAKS